jgi:dTDP-4-amino-4,6-dideoxygalactose transaminase
MHAAQVRPRRYFHPVLDQVFASDPPADCPVAADIGSRILCLPLSHQLTAADVDRVVSLLPHCAPP